MGYALYSFMDGYSGYNQIYIAEDDVPKTAFRCPGALGCYECVVMPFGLKNAGATYQRAMNLIFHDMIGDFVEVYVDDIVAKAVFVDDYFVHLRRLFERMRVYGLKLNPLKCAFGVTAGNFLGFLVHQRGIEIEPNKAQAALRAEPPKIKKELQRFLGQVNFLRRFITNRAGRTKAFSSLLKLKAQDEFVWTQEHQDAFDALKAYLTKPPVMAPRVKGRPFKLYIAAEERSMGAMLAQEDDLGHDSDENS
ncbi:hypothetical protein Dimus_038137 [Dionaea muscipula]